MSTLQSLLSKINVQQLGGRTQVGGAGLTTNPAFIGDEVANIAWSGSGDANAAGANGATALPVDSDTAIAMDPVAATAHPPADALGGDGNTIDLGTAQTIGLIGKLHPLAVYRRIVYLQSATGQAAARGASLITGGMASGDPFDGNVAGCFVQSRCLMKDSYWQYVSSS